jgi:thiamine biosynthesis protein ThiS
MRLAAAAASFACLPPPDHTSIFECMDTAVRVTVNGEARTFADATTVAGLLASIGLDTRKVAVERNEAIVPRSAYAATFLADGDALEIVHFIGGG